MKTLHFYKYQGTGNDFVMVDNRDLQFTKTCEIIEKLCDRRFGIGGDGLILLEDDTENPAADFKMIYYNSDGKEGSMCGNGGRCLVAFAHFLNLFEDKCTFSAIDGPHNAEIRNGNVRLKMIDVEKINKDGDATVMNTGSPHYVKFVEDLDNFEVHQKGYEIRNSPVYSLEGINVNFVEQIKEDQLFVRTYERGVEEETYSCGTGATAAALTYLQHHEQNSVSIKVLGGQLKVYAEKYGQGFKNIWLEGPAVQVYSGKINI